MGKQRRESTCSGKKWKTTQEPILWEEKRGDQLVEYPFVNYYTEVELNKKPRKVFNNSTEVEIIDEEGNSVHGKFHYFLECSRRWNENKFVPTTSMNKFWMAIQMEGTSKFSLFPADKVAMASREFDPDLYSYESADELKEAFDDLTAEIKMIWDSDGGPPTKIPFIDPPSVPIEDAEVQLNLGPVFKDVFSLLLYGRGAPEKDREYRNISLLSRLTPPPTVVIFNRGYTSTSLTRAYLGHRVVQIPQGYKIVGPYSNGFQKLFWGTSIIEIKLGRVLRSNYIPMQTFAPPTPNPPTYSTPAKRAVKIARTGDGESDISHSPGTVQEVLDGMRATLQEAVAQQIKIALQPLQPLLENKGIQSPSIPHSAAAPEIPVARPTVPPELLPIIELPKMPSLQGRGLIPMGQEGSLPAHPQVFIWNAMERAERAEQVARTIARQAEAEVRLLDDYIMRQRHMYMQMGMLYKQ